MTDFTDAQLRRAPWMRSRIPALAALTAFIPTGEVPSPAVQAAAREAGASRWYPVEHGHRLVIRHEGGDYDAMLFTLEQGAWDHEHCDRCAANIPAMTLCWVTERDPYVLLCVTCHDLVTGGTTA